MKWSVCLQTACAVQLTWSAQLISLRKLFLNICRISLPEFFGPPKNNVAEPSPALSWSLQRYFYLHLFSAQFLPPTAPICPDLYAKFPCRCHSWFSYILYCRLRSLTAGSKLLQISFTYASNRSGPNTLPVGILTLLRLPQIIAKAREGKARKSRMDINAFQCIAAPNNNWEQESATDWDRVLVYRPQAKCVCSSVGRYVT